MGTSAISLQSTILPKSVDKVPLESWIDMDGSLLILEQKMQINEKIKITEIEDNRVQPCKNVLECKDNWK